MSSGSIFTLLTNDGKQDQILLSSKYLADRLAALEMRRKQAGIADSAPTIADIQATHVFFFNVSFKPFVAHAFEYVKVKPSTSVTLGTEIQFSIPQFGDFFSDMFLYVRFASVTTTGGDGSTSAGKTPRILRYADYPGERLCEEVKFEVNGNILDEYQSSAYNFYRLFNVAPNKKLGYDKCMGQQTPKLADLHKEYSTTTAPTISGFDTQAQLYVSDGHQAGRTAGTAVPALELMIPLLFWFNLDPRQAIPSVTIPYGQRYIKVKLAAQEKLIGLSNLGALGATHTTPYAVPSLTISEISLYINNIFVKSEIHRIFIQRVGFIMIRVHIQHTQQIDKATDSIILNRLKWPIEYMYIGFRPLENEVQSATYKNTDTSGNESFSVSNANDTLAHRDFSLWHRFDFNVYDDVALDSFSIRSSTATETSAKALYWKRQPLVKTLGMQLHGIDIFKDIPSKMLNAYVPYNYGGQNINTPNDEGAYMWTFALYPGDYQPSGYLNVSRAREFYLNYTSDLIGTSTGINASAVVAKLIVLACAINFLVYADGSAVLRYAT